MRNQTPPDQQDEKKQAPPKAKSYMPSLDMLARMSRQIRQAHIEVSDEVGYAKDQIVHELKTLRLRNVVIDLAIGVIAGILAGWVTWMMLD